MRYIGGKFRIRQPLIDYLLPIIQDSESDCFVDLFCGSLNITLSLFEDNPLFMPNKLIINDFHEDLILLWKAIVYENWVPPSDFTKEEYEELRNAEPSALRAFIGYGCSFGGIWFSQFAQTSDDRNYCLNAKRSVEKVGDLLRWANEHKGGVQIYNKSYEDVEIPDGSVVYADPPYFATARPGCGNEFDHEKFWQYMRELSRKNEVFISEYIAPEDFKCVREIPTKLDMNGEERIEKLFKYKG
jgi:DNA adenine methylase